MKKKKILIDITSLFDQYSSRGIGRYTRELMKRLVRMVVDENSWELSLVGFNDLDKNLIDIGYSQFAVDELKPHIEFHTLGKSHPSDVKNIFEWKKFDEIIYESEPDVYFAPHFERGLPSTKGLKHQFTNLKTAVVYHDAIPLVTNTFSNKGFIANWVKKKFYEFLLTGIKNADMIFAPSNFSKNDIVKLLNVDEEVVKVIYLGVDESFHKSIQTYPESEEQEILNRFQINDTKYFYYDSGLEANKGIADLLIILEKFFQNKEKSLPMNIVITGGDFYKGAGEGIKAKTGLGKQFIRKAKAKGLLSNLVTTGRIDDDELKIILRNSTAYIYLSEYEGFGFGPIQAMASEIPTIVRSASCLPEITDGAALLVDPQDVDKTVKEIGDLLKNEKEINQLIKKGIVVAKKYDWKTTAELTWHNLKSLVNQEENAYSAIRGEDAD